jgi:transposase
LRPTNRASRINGECFRTAFGSADSIIIIRAAGAMPWYLPHYSPDLNPIEQAFAKIKHWMRAVQKRTVDEFCRHIGLISTITQDTFSIKL